MKDIISKRRKELGLTQQELADKYLNFTELTNELVDSLIDHIEILSIRLIIKKEINIIYRFIC